MICKRAKLGYVYLMTRLITLTFYMFCLSFTPAASAQSHAENQRLDKIHSKIMTDYPQLSHISSEEMTALLTDEDVLFLDVRESKEYAVSHIDGAIRVDPKISGDEFTEIYGDAVSGKTVVLYCSVGRRSSKLGNRVRADLMAAGAKSVSNLEGGIFRWHNEGRPVTRETGATEKIHPFNRWWSRLVARKDDIAYAAE
ncbi:MAG: rhodanese-like domain-containing protein [Maricaulaceae bacterium]